jgi:hypothetical protein
MFKLRQKQMVYRAHVRAQEKPVCRAIAAHVDQSYNEQCSSYRSNVPIVRYSGLRYAPVPKRPVALTMLVNHIHFTRKPSAPSGRGSVCVFGISTDFLSV